MPQQTAPPEPGLECFEQMTNPEYPETALHERIDGTVWTTIHLNAQAGVDKIDTEVVSAYSAAKTTIAPAVEKAIRASKFKADCAGKTVHVAFRYWLAGDAVPSPQPSVRQEPPNVVWIESQPPAKVAPRATKAKP